MTLTLLHTSPAHLPTFAKLRDQLAPHAPLNQQVREEWLDQARANGITPDLAAQIETFVATAPGPVICTCTTLGPAAEAAGATRIDRPMMQAAGQIGGRIIMAYALDSTLEPSRSLLAVNTNDDAEIVPLDLTGLWHFFEQGDIPRFDNGIATAIRKELRDNGGDCVVLAQASMAGAAVLLCDIAQPVLASPELALRAGLQAQNGA